LPEVDETVTSFFSSAFPTRCRAPACLRRRRDFDDDGYAEDIDGYPNDPLRH